MIRAAVDTNVLVSALLSPRGTPALLLRAWIDGEFEMVASPQLLGELDEVLSRPKLRSIVPPRDRKRLEDQIRRRAIVVDDPVAPERLAPDPDDDFLIALTRASGASVLVSGDARLTSVRNSEPPILTPRAFFAALTESSHG